MCEKEQPVHYSQKKDVIIARNHYECHFNVFIVLPWAYNY